MTEQLPIKFEPEFFENCCVDNGMTYWSARKLMEMLNYSDYREFKKVINRAIKACLSIGLEIDDNFIPIEIEIDGSKVNDYKLSRFACYLISINGNPKNPEVAKAQAYFISLAEAFKNYLNESNNLDRLIIRDEITDKERSLSGVANNAGVMNYPLFQNAGYRGLYNMNMRELKRIRGIDVKESLLNYMGKTELAANLFRITQTEEKIKNERISGQRDLEYTAEKVGEKVRETIINIQGTLPEYLPKESHINDVRKNIKAASKEFKKLDSKKKKK